VTTWVIFPARRAVEHAITVPELVPLRIFAVLWPLWEADTTATICDEPNYDLIDRFLTRAVLDARVDRVDDLATFLGLPETLVRRCLSYLSNIQHVRLDGDTVQVTELGAESVRADIRFEWKESRQKLLIERHTGQPLPRRYYGGSIPILQEPAVDRSRTDGSPFVPLFTAKPFEEAAVLQLEKRQDRAEFNLPRRLRDLRVLSSADAYLPAYLLETDTHGLLVYTMAAPERDGFFEEVCRVTSSIGDRIQAERRHDPQQLWTEWLARGRAGVGTLRQLSNGVWRATFSGDAFGPQSPHHPVNRAGTFCTYRNQFIQVWCDDDTIRRAALFERAFLMVRAPELATVAEYEHRLAAFARQLELPPIDAQAVRRRAIAKGRHDLVSRIDAL